MEFDEYDYLERAVGEQDALVDRSRSRRHDEVRDREREPEIVDTRENRRFKDKKEMGEAEADPERDQRTVFAYQMPLKATERHVYEFFSKAGKVRDVRLIMDRNSRRSKGVGYIEFYESMSVPMAIALSGQLLLGQPVMVKPSEAEKNLVQSNASAATGGATGPYGAVDRKLYVGNLHFNMTEMQLRQIFEPFGTVELVQLPLDLETGQCKGFGFVQFAHLEHSKAAQSALNGKLEIAGRTIKVSLVTDHVGAQDTAPKSADFDDDDGGGLALNAQSRAMLMAKLDRSGIATSITGALGVAGLNGLSAPQLVGLPVTGQATLPLSGQVFPSVSEPVGLPSECLLLKNLFDPSTETDPEFDLDIKEDVEEECSRYGAVKHIYVEKHSAGNVYLRFESVEGASKAQQAMHMRWFARRLISAIYLQPYEYDAKFKNNEKGSDEIALKAMGRAINKTVMIAELIKTRIVDLHQNTSIASTHITDLWEPLEEGLLPLSNQKVAGGNYNGPRDYIGDGGRGVSRGGRGRGRGRNSRGRGLGYGGQGGYNDYADDTLPANNRGGRGSGRGRGHGPGRYTRQDGPGRYTRQDGPVQAAAA
ncbi:hypothetical protein ACFE04_017508 [Oxalis oulophora]